MDFIGIDPGKKGAIVHVGDAPGQRWLGIYDMPDTIENLLQLVENIELFHPLPSLKPVVKIGLEWPTMRPGEGGERGRKLGINLGHLEMAFHSILGDVKRIPPQTWTRYFKLPGKKIKGWKEARLKLAEEHYPKAIPDLHGPRGGLLDGRLDALLIAHYLREKT